MVDASNRGNVEWQALVSARCRRGAKRSENALRLEAEIRRLLGRVPDPVTAGVWIELEVPPRRGLPLRETGGCGHARPRLRTESPIAEAIIA
jgi:hypothetical protein